jgi:hypothetical protein
LRNATATYYIIDNSNDGSSMKYQLSYTSGKLRFRFGGSTVDSLSVSANAWHTVIAWYDSANDKAYIQVDGASPQNLSNTTGAPDTTYPLRFGNSIGGRPIRWTAG